MACQYNSTARLSINSILFISPPYYYTQADTLWENIEVTKKRSVNSCIANLTMVTTSSAQYPLAIVTTLQSIMDAKISQRKFLDKTQVSKQCHLPYVFHKKGHPKNEQQRALHVYQRKTKHFIAKLFSQPFPLLHTFLILVTP